jgi:hypothetical protein
VVFKVVFRDEARKAFERLDRAVRQHVRRVIDGLAAWEELFAGYHAFMDARTGRGRATTRHGTASGRTSGSTPGAPAARASRAR